MNKTFGDPASCGSQALLVEPFAPRAEAGEHSGERQEGGQDAAHNAIDEVGAGTHEGRELTSKPGGENRTCNRGEATKGQHHGERGNKEKCEDAGRTEPAQPKKRRTGHQKTACSKDQDKGDRHHPVGMCVQLEWTERSRVDEASADEMHSQFDERGG